MSTRRIKSLFTLGIVLVGIGYALTNKQVYRDLTTQNTKEVITPTKSEVLGNATAAPSSTSVPTGNSSEIASEKTYSVTKVVDGDTIQIETGQKVRYIGINTPETHHPTKGVECFGKQAYEKNKELVEGKRVRLEKDISETDRYGRLLRFVYLDNTFINDYLVRQGYAHATTYPPDVKFADEFRQAEVEARENNRGLWNSCK